MIYPGFLGGSDTRRSVNANDERTVNLYPEIVKGRVTLFPTPGASLFLRVPQGPVRALFYQDGRAFMVAADTFYEWYADGSYHTEPTWKVAFDQKMATIHTNGNYQSSGGHQLFVVSGGNGYVYDLNTNAFAQIADPDFPDHAEMGAFLDGYFLVLAKSTFYLSDLEDGTSWNGLDVGQLSQSTNSIVSMITTHGDVLFLGSKTSEVWTDTGNASFPLQPRGGALIEQGCIAPFSAQNVDNTVIWLGADALGSGVVYRNDGYSPKRISTPAVEFALQSYPRIDDAVGWTYQQAGHLFYVLVIPSADTSWCFDCSLPPEVAWHERAVWNKRFMRWQPYRGQCHTFGFNKHIIGDRLTGALYELDLDAYAEDWAI